STLTALAGLIIILQEKDGSPSKWRPFVAGVFAGLSFCFTHTRGLLVLAAFVIAYWFAVRKDTSQKWQACMLIVAGCAAAILLLVGAALFLSIAYAPTHFRMGMISLPAFILLIWYLGSRGRLASRLLIIALALFASVTLPAGIIHSQGTGFAIIDTPSGKIAA